MSKKASQSHTDFRTTMISAIIVFVMRSQLFLISAALLFSIPSSSIGADENQPKVEKTTSHYKKKHRKKRRRCDSYVSPRYSRMIRRWQRIPEIRKPRFREGYRDLTVYAVNLGKRIRVFPYLPDGSLDPDAISEFQSIFQDKHSGVEHPVHPRLIKLLYKLADRFKARQINLISGFREATEEKSEGNHTRGRAADIMIPGVSLGAVARIARRFGHVGVGFYPRSGFIHFDVRDGPSFFWVDRSGPGKPGCLRRTMTETAAKFDRRWKPQKDEPKRHVNRKGKPRGAIKKPHPISEPDEIDMDKETRPVP